MVEPSAAFITNVVSSTNTDKTVADAIVAIITNIRDSTTATKTHENGLVYGSSTVRPNFPSI